MTKAKNNKKNIELFKQSLPTFMTLNDENRQEIIMILADKGSEGVSVDDITKRMHLSRPTISHHLKLLSHSGIVSVRKEGTKHFYFLTLKNAVNELKELITMLENTCELI